MYISSGKSHDKFFVCCAKMGWSYDPKEAHEAGALPFWDVIAPLQYSWCHSGPKLQKWNGHPFWNSRRGLPCMDKPWSPAEVGCPSRNRGSLCDTTFWSPQTCKFNSLTRLREGGRLHSSGCNIPHPRAAGITNRFPSVSVPCPTDSTPAQGRWKGVRCASLSLPMPTRTVTG